MSNAATDVAQKGATTSGEGVDGKPLPDFGGSSPVALISVGAALVLAGRLLNRSRQPTEIRTRNHGRREDRPRRSRPV